MRSQPVPGLSGLAGLAEGDGGRVVPEFVVSLNSPNLTTGREGRSCEGALGEALGLRMIELCLRLRLLAIVTGEIGGGTRRDQGDGGFWILNSCSSFVVGSWELGVVKN